MDFDFFTLPSLGCVLIVLRLVLLAREHALKLARHAPGRELVGTCEASIIHRCNGESKQKIHRSRECLRMIATIVEVLGELVE